MAFFVDQDITITLTVTDAVTAAVVDLTGATNPVIGYIDPNGKQASWVAVLVSPPNTGKVEYDLPRAANTLKGLWSVWVEYDLAGDHVVTTPIKFEIQRKGNNPA